jgi:hypothetical protein
MVVSQRLAIVYTFVAFGDGTYLGSPGNLNRFGWPRWEELPALRSKMSPNVAGAYRATRARPQFCHLQLQLCLYPLGFCSLHVARPRSPSSSTISRPTRPCDVHVMRMPWSSLELAAALAIKNNHSIGSVCRLERNRLDESHCHETSTAARSVAVGGCVPGSG